MQSQTFSFVCRPSRLLTNSPSHRAGSVKKEGPSSSFHKLCKIESGSSVERRSLISLAQARASLALEEEEADDEPMSSPKRSVPCPS